MPKFLETFNSANDYFLVLRDIWRWRHLFDCVAVRTDEFAKAQDLKTLKRGHFYLVIVDVN